MSTSTRHLTHTADGVRKLPEISESVSFERFQRECHKRKGIKFHDGNEVTAEVVAFTIRRAAGPSSIGVGTTGPSAFLNARPFDSESFRCQTHSL